MIIRLDAHTHTVASDHAYSTALENCAAAAKAGISFPQLIQRILDYGLQIPPFGKRPPARGT